MVLVGVVVRQHFWITAGEAVKRTRNECLACRSFQPIAALQMMVDVHRVRLGAHHPPFTYYLSGLFRSHRHSLPEGGSQTMGCAVHIPVVVQLLQVESRLANPLQEMEVRFPSISSYFF